MQAGRQIENSRICAIAREKEPHQYRITFEVAEKFITDKISVEIHCLWNDQILAIAKGKKLTTSVYNSFRKRISDFLRRK